MRKFLADKFSVAIQRVRRASKPVMDWGAELTHAERVQAAYRGVLNRVAEPEGLVHWERFLARGSSFDALLQSFLKSPEFRRRLEAQGLVGKVEGQLLGAAAVQAASRCLLGRDAEVQEQARWQAFLRGGRGLQDMLIEFVRSPEFAQRLDRNVPDGRNVSSASANHAVGQSLPIEIVSSTEFAQQLDPGVPDGRNVSAASADLPTGQRRVAGKRKQFAVIGNCQTAAMIRCLQALTGCEMPTLGWTRPDLLEFSESARAEAVELFSSHDKVFVQVEYWAVLSKLHPELADQVILYPTVAFAAYHPDVVYVRHRETRVNVASPLHDYHSSIAFLGWHAGLAVDRTIELFNADVFNRLGFFDAWEPSLVALIEEGRAAGIELGEMVESWRRRGNFMRSMNHPKLFVNLDVARAVLQKHRIPIVCFDVEPYVYDWLSVGSVWPVYPEIAERFGIAGHYCFKLEAPKLEPDLPIRTLNLREYVQASFDAFSAFAKSDLECERLESSRYQQVLNELRTAANGSEVAPKQAPVVSAVDASLKCAVLGNGQAKGMSRCLQALLGGSTPLDEHVTPERLTDWESGRSSLVPLFSAHDKVFMQPWVWKPLAQRYARFENKVVLYPSVAFIAYHPDLVDVQIGRSGIALADGPMGKCHSSLALLAWKAGLRVDETVGLFRGDVLQRMGFFDWWNSSESALLEEGRATGLSLEAPLARWKAQGCFMHFPAHPKLFVLADIARAVLDRLGIAMRPFDLTEFAHDHLGDDVAWPVYPELGRDLGCPGSYEFKQRLLGPIDFSPVTLLSLEQFVEQSFAAFARHQPDELICRRLNWPAYLDAMQDLVKFRTLGPRAPTLDRNEAPPAALRPESLDTLSPPSSHPYAGLPAHRFWRKAIQSVPTAQIDPVIRTKFRIGPDTRVATAGSCFALNISRRLLQRGYNFLNAEPGQEGPRDAVEGVGGMGLFSARFGYVYTARQMRQLMERAYGRFNPDERAWTLETGRYVDPFRPRVEPDGFATVADLEQARAIHLAAVRKMFETLDVMVFTLGMTEAWRSRSDGAVFSVAPGVAGGKMDFDRYEFVNFSVAEVDADLQAFIDALRHVNPGARVILTVSPVPILATYADRHVLVSSTYTKSVLRVAADQVVQRHEFCDYFPGYELVNSSIHRGRYIEDDLRSVTSEGVDHVMRLFFTHYSGDGVTDAPGSLDAEMLAEARKSLQVVCDEELLDAGVVR